MAEAVDQLPPGAFHPLASNWCHSVYVESFKVDFEWTIHHYEIRCPGISLLSAIFPAMKVNELNDQSAGRWYLHLNDNGLWLESCPPYTTHDMRVKTAFVNAKREKVFSTEITFINKNNSNRVHTAKREIILDKSNELIVNGALTIYCEIQTCNDEKDLSGQTAAYGISHEPLNDKEGLLEDFEKLFENTEHSDVAFNVGCQKFQAHKNILVTRSPVFAAMFKHPSKEKLLGIVDVPDIDPEVFKVLLRYIYTGKVSLKQMDEVAIGLLAAADKYLLEKLKQACGVYLVKNICKHFLKLLLLDDENHPAHYLKGKALSYFLQFPAKVMETNSWKKANIENPELIANVKIILFESLVQQSKTDSI